MSAQLRYKIMIGITAGMVHLEYEEIVHRDLAGKNLVFKISACITLFFLARNVLLTKEREAKISDFGMSRSLEGNAAKKTKSDVGPLKWLVFLKFLLCYFYPFFVLGWLPKGFFSSNH